jgi:hypothetical protein
MSVREMSEWEKTVDQEIKKWYKTIDKTCLYPWRSMFNNTDWEHLYDEEKQRVAELFWKTKR